MIMIWRMGGDHNHEDDNVDFLSWFVFWPLTCFDKIADMHRVKNALKLDCNKSTLYTLQTCTFTKQNWKIYHSSHIYLSGGHFSLGTQLQYNSLWLTSDCFGNLSLSQLGFAQCVHFSNDLHIYLDISIWFKYLCHVGATLGRVHFMCFNPSGYVTTLFVLSYIHYTYIKHITSVI